MLTVAVRRFRNEALAITGVLLAVGLLALVTGMQMRDEYRSSGLAECLAGGGECDILIDRFGDKFDNLEIFIVPLVLLPALLGAFVGAPLVAREVEAGTHRFLWTQGVTRSRWFAYVASTAVAVALAAGALYSVIAALWLDTTNSVTGGRLTSLYEFQGALPIGASILATSVGIACGVLLRRTLPAMVATLAVFVVVRMIVATQIRPQLAAPELLDMPVGPNEPVALRDAWIVSETTFDASGRVLGYGGTVQIPPDLAERCPRTGNPVDFEAVDRCLQQLGVHTVLEYHPADRFWHFQLIESGILVAVAAVSLVVAAGLLRRRAV